MPTRERSVHGDKRRVEIGRACPHCGSQVQVFQTGAGDKRGRWVCVNDDQLGVHRR